MFSVATTTGRGLSECQVLCSKNCSCSGFFYRSSSKSCFLLRDRPGSVFQSSASRASTVAGYIKIVQGGSPSNQTPDKGRRGGLLLIAQIILPCLAASALIVIFALGFLWWRRYRHAKHFKGRKFSYGHNASPSTVDDNEDDEDSIAIPGLPARFTLAEMEEATEGFKTCIGTGGFGVVYKGVLPDKTPIAVKKIGGVGVHGKREFCTEIAVIGNIHHINLARRDCWCTSTWTGARSTAPSSGPRDIQCLSGKNARTSRSGQRADSRTSTRGATTRSSTATSSRRTYSSTGRRR
ncbi:G-type lectin S-receptor-like serine/threonine-protein kinase [Acorus calamus]|uniref:G-type lectin S-receptor-like serine/threonine-protein kinase n=1 Tax=Acorus calamus TaxID=4465 RepID=A0AAV9E8A2_ACOCL|nr:G-type lectin S-receptor-like serine/threonine-protein kinase [Acorus calamus]